MHTLISAFSLRLCETWNKLPFLLRNFLSRLLELAGLVLLLTFVFISFGTAGYLTGNFTTKIDEVRALGDPRVIYPLSYIYFTGLALVMFFKPGGRAHKYFISVCKIAIDGIIFFFALIAAYRIYFYDNLTPKLVLGLFILLVAPVLTDVLLSNFEKRAKDRLFRIIISFVIISCAWVLLDNNMTNGNP